MRRPVKARRGSIRAVFDRGTTQAGRMQRQPNAGGLSPRAASAQRRRRGARRLESRRGRHLSREPRSRRGARPRREGHHHRRPCARVSGHAPRGKRVRRVRAPESHRQDIATRGRGGGGHGRRRPGHLTEHRSAGLRRSGPPRDPRRSDGGATPRVATASSRPVGRGWWAELRLLQSPRRDRTVLPDFERERGVPCRHGRRRPGPGGPGLSWGRSGTDLGGASAARRTP